MTGVESRFFFLRESVRSRVVKFWDSVRFQRRTRVMQSLGVGV